MSDIKIQPGDLIKVKRCDPIPYWHWGVYIGNGEIIHLSGAEFDLAAKATAHVHRLTLTEFLCDSEQFEIIPCPPDVSREEVVERAKSAENDWFRNQPYDLLTNNCEHFARWCHGAAESKQVQDAVTWGAIGAAAVVGTGLLIWAMFSSGKEEKKKENYQYN